MRRTLCALALLGLMTTEAVADAGYDKGFFINDGGKGAAELKINGHFLPQYRWLSADAGGDADRDNQQAIQMAKARIKFSGHVHDKSLKFFLQADFAKSAVSIKDAGVEYVAIPDTVHLKLGQFKKPFGGQQLTSASKLELTDRALSDHDSPSGRDVGVQVGNGDKREVTWAAGVFNGNGTSGTPADFQPTAALRVVYRHNNIKNYSEGDLEGGPLRFAVAGNVNADLNATNDADAAITAGGDVVVKVQGLSVSGEFYKDMTKDAEKMGFYGQLGYVIGGRWQPVVRYSMVDPDGDGNNTTEITGGLSVYYRKHDVKWQTSFSMLTHEGTPDDLTDRLVLTQLQLLL